MTYDKHITVLSILYIGVGGLVLLGGILTAAILLGTGILSGDQDAALATMTISVFIAGFLTLMAIPALIGGWGLLKRKSWARILVLVLGFLNLLSVPLGTALGIYTIWLLMQDQAESYFSAGGFQAPTIEPTSDPAPAADSQPSEDSVSA